MEPRCFVVRLISSTLVFASPESAEHNMLYLLQTRHMIAGFCDRADVQTCRPRFLNSCSFNRTPRSQSVEGGGRRRGGIRGCQSSGLQGKVLAIYHVCCSTSRKNPLVVLYPWSCVRTFHVPVSQDHRCPIIARCDLRRE